jgi:hypothetical protein
MGLSVLHSFGYLPASVRRAKMELLVDDGTNQARYREKISHRGNEGQDQPGKHHPPIRQFLMPAFHLIPPYPRGIVRTQNGNRVT